MIDTKVWIDSRIICKGSKLVYEIHERIKSSELDWYSDESDAIEKKKNEMMETIGVDSTSWEYWNAMSGTSGFECNSYNKKTILQELAIIALLGGVGKLFVHIKEGCMPTKILGFEIGNGFIIQSDCSVVSNITTSVITIEE